MVEYEKKLSELADDERDWHSFFLSTLNDIQTLYERLISTIGDSNDKDEINLIHKIKKYFEEGNETMRSLVSKENYEYFSSIKNEIMNLISVVVDLVVSNKSKATLISSFDAKTTELELLNQSKTNIIMNVQESLDIFCDQTVNLNTYVNVFNSVNTHTDVNKSLNLSLNSPKSIISNSSSPINKSFGNSLTSFSPNRFRSSSPKSLRNSLNSNNSLTVNVNQEELKRKMTTKLEVIANKLKTLEIINSTYEENLNKLVEYINVVCTTHFPDVNQSNLLSINVDIRQEILSDNVNNFMEKVLTIINVLSESHSDLIGIKEIIEKCDQSSVDLDIDIIEVLKTILSNFKTDIFNLEDSLVLCNENLSEAVNRNNNLMKSFKEVTNEYKVLNNKMNSWVISTLFNRYILLKSYPIHKSKYVTIYEALDSDNIDDDEKCTKVVIKFIKSRQKYAYMLRNYEAQFDANYVYQIVSHHTRNGSDHDNENASTINSSDFFASNESSISKVIESNYAVVMPLAEGNLEQYLSREMNNGLEFATIRSIFTQLVLATLHIHKKGFVHGSVRPDHSLMDKSSWRLTGISGKLLLYYYNYLYYN